MSGTDIKKRLQFINDKMVASANQSVFLGKNAINQSSTDTLFIPQLLSFTDFNDKWLPSALPAAATVSTVLENLYIVETTTTNGTATLTWKKASDATLTVANQSKFKVKTFDMNYTPLLQSSGSLYKNGTVSLNTKGTDAATAAQTNFTGLLDLLNTVRITYNFLDDANFKKYKADDTTLTVDKYECTFANNTVSYLAVPFADAITHVSKIIPNIATLNHASSNILAIRRVLLGYELLIHTYLAMKILSLYDTVNTNSDANIKLKMLVEASIAKTIGLNDASYDENSGVGTLQTKLEERVSLYNNYRQSIDTVDKKVSDAKLNISTQHNMVQSNAKFFKTNQILYYVFMSLFIIGLVLLAVSQQKAPNPSNQTKFIVSVIFSVSLVALVVMFMVNKYLLREAFASLPNSTLDRAVSTDIDNLRSLYQDVALSALNDYLTNTIYISLLMGTYRRYGDISHALQKEFTYYDSLLVQLHQSNDKLNGMQVYDYRMSKVLQYRVYMFLQILSVLALVVLINLYMGTSNSLIALGVFLCLFFVYLYMVNMNNLVRTDARKLYWETPSATLLS